MAKKKKEAAPEPIETQLWKAAVKLRKNIDAAEYKHIVLGLVFLKYISDAFVELYARLSADKGEYPSPHAYFIIVSKEHMIPLCLGNGPKGLFQDYSGTCRVYEQIVR